MDFQARYKFNPTTDLLGKGGFSKVYKANDTLLDRTVALKFFTGSGADQYQILNEIKKVIRFQHPNLCKYYDVAVLTNRNVLGETDRIEVGIMEYIDAGDFKTYTRKHPESTDKLLIDVLKGLAYLHKHGIAHRDLKPQNILIKIEDDEPVSKITDFGISKLINSDDNNSSILVGTIEYMAPEQFNPRKYGINGRITTNLDLWSFGLLVYEAVCHKSFFGSRSSGISAEQVMANILSDTSLEKADTLPPKYREIIKKCLVKNASERVKNALELLPFLENKFTSLDTIQTDKGDASVAKPQVTHGIEPKSEVTEEATQGNRASSQATSEVTQTIDSTAKEVANETRVVSPEADVNTNETQVVESTAGTTEVTEVIDSTDKAATGDTQVIEPETDTTTNETQVVKSTADTTEVTQVIGSTDKAATDETRVIEHEADTTTIETQSVKSTSGATEVTQTIEPTRGATKDEIQINEAAPNTPINGKKIFEFVPDTTKEAEVVGTTAEPAPDTTTTQTGVIETVGDSLEGKDITESNRETTADETQVIEPGPSTATAETEVFATIPEKTREIDVIGYISEATTGEAEHFEPVPNPPTDEIKVIDATAHMIEQTRVIERVPELTKEETQVTEPFAQDTAAITQAMKLVPETRGDGDEALENSRAKSVLKRESINRQSGSDAKETGKEESVQKPLKKVIVLSGAALLLIFLFIAYLLFNGPFSRPYKNTHYSEERRVNDTDLGKTGTIEIGNDVHDTEKSTTPANETRNDTTPDVELSKNTIAVYFSTPETFWLKIKNGGGKVISHKKMIKGSKQPLYLGVGKYQLTFQNAGGNEVFDSSFHVTNGMLKAPAYTYKINFKNAITNLPNSAGTNPSDNAGVKLPDNAGINRSNNKEITPSSNGEINPSSNVGVYPSNNSGVNPSNNSGVNPSNNSGVNSSNNEGINSSNNEGINPSNHTNSPPNPSPTLATINELAANMVTVPAGSFTMGDTTRAMKSLKPRAVTINSIRFGKHEVTQQQWKTIMGDNNSGNQGCDNCPVENVSWNDVTSFISKINKMSNNRFRLPTEAEWEYVARRALRNEIENPGTKREKQIETVLQQNVWYNENAEGKTHPVGKKKPLSEIYDLLGNVAEWCSEKVVKGGSYKDRKDDLKPILRNKESPSRKKKHNWF